MATSERRALSVNEAQAAIAEELERLRNDGSGAGIGQPVEEEQAAIEEAEEALEGAVAEFDEDEGSAEEASESEETEAELPDEEVAEEADEEEPEPERSTFTVMVDGQPQEVTLDEALAGYQRTADYTAKTQALAEQRNALEAERHEFIAERDQARQMLGQLEELLAHEAGQEPDWATLAETLSAQEYNKRRAEWERSQSEIQTVRAERQRQEQQMQQALLEQHQQRVAQEEARLQSHFPDWDEKLDEWKAFAQSTYGYDPQELNAIADHRAFRVINDAMQYRRIEAQAPKVRKKAKSPSMKPGRATPASERTTREERALKEEYERFRQGGGKVDDASRLIERKLRLLKKQSR